MTCVERPDDFDTRRAHLRAMSEEDLKAYFWTLVGQIVEPLVEEARTHTTPSIERSVLLRMGFSSIEATSLTDAFRQRGLLAQGAGRLVLELAKARELSVRQAGEALLRGEHWAELAR